MASRKTSDLAVLPAAGMLATHYLHVYMPEQVADVDKDQRVSLASLEDYLLSASSDLRLTAGTGILGPDPFAGAIYSSANYISIAGIQDSGSPSVGGYIENLSTGATANYFLQDGYYGFNVNDGGVAGYSIQGIANSALGTYTFTLGDPSSQITETYSVGGGAPYWLLDMYDASNSHNIGVTPLGFSSNSSNNLVLMNYDTGYLSFFPFAGVKVDNGGAYTVLEGVIDAAGAFILLSELTEVSSGDKTHINLIDGEIAIRYISGSDGGYSRILVNDIQVLTQVWGDGSGITGNVDFNLYWTSGHGVLDTYAGDGANEYAGLQLNGGNSTITISSDNGVQGTNFIISSSGMSVSVDYGSFQFAVQSDGLIVANVHNNAGTPDLDQIRSVSDQSAPTVTDLANCTTSSAQNFKYSLVGRVLTFSFRLDVNISAPNVETKFAFTLPVASNFPALAFYDLSGVVVSGAAGNLSGELTADPTTDQGRATFTPSVSGPVTMTVFGQYTLKI